MGDIFAIVYEASTWVIPVLLAVTLHEAAHGYAALLFGDDTAKRAGRISLNPIRHVDPLGTVVLPALLLLFRSPILFGYAKPVPVNFRNLRPQRLGSAIVAAAGPATNVVQALLAVGLLALVLPDAVSLWVIRNFFNVVIINVALAIFNMLPILPLDGGRIIAALLPPPLERVFRRTEAFGLPFILLLFLVPEILGYNFLGQTLGVLVGEVVEVLLRLTGVEFD